jgi:hypothetical protein
VRAPGVNDTTDPRMRDGATPTTTSSENTSPVKLDAGARLVFLAEERRIFMSAFSLSIMAGHDTDAGAIDKRLTPRP